MYSVSQSVAIVNKRGLHARASARFVEHVSSLPKGIVVEVEKEGTRVVGTSIMGLLMLGAACGDSIIIHARAESEGTASESSVDTALQTLVALVADSFGESEA